MHTQKARQCRAFLIVVILLELRSKPCFKGLLKKPLKNPQNFRPEYTNLFLRKLLRFQRTFHEKSFGRGLGRIAPTDYAHTKNTAYAVFFAFYKILRSFLYIVWIIKPPYIVFAVIILAQLFIIPLSLNITGSSSSSILSIFPSQ